jgi:hypothetical protein
MSGWIVVRIYEESNASKNDGGSFSPIAPWDIFDGEN